MKTRIFILAVTIFLSSLLSLFPTVAIADSLATVKLSSIQGDVLVKKGGGLREYLATDGMTLSQGDWLRTGSKGSVNLEFSNKTQTTIGANSELIIENLTNENSNTVGRENLKTIATGSLWENISIKLWAGSVWNRVATLLNVNDQFQVETPTAIMGVHGTLYLVKVDSNDGSTSGDVFEGLVAISQNKEQSEGGQQRMVSMGQQLQIQASAPSEQKAIDQKALIESTDSKLLVQVITDVITRAKDLMQSAKDAQTNFQQTQDLILITNALSLATKAAELANFAKDFVNVVETSTKVDAIKEVLTQNNQTLEQIQTTLDTVKIETNQTQNQVISAAKDAGLSQEDINKTLQDAILPTSNLETTTTTTTTPKGGDSTNAIVTKEALTVSNPSTTGFTVILNPALAGLAGSNFVLKDDHDIPVTNISATTSNSGETYTISVSLTAGKTYSVTAAKAGYNFGTAQNVAIANIQNPGNGSWVPIGSERFTNGKAANISLDIDATTGQPYVAFGDQSGESSSYSKVMTYDENESSWKSVGDSSLYTGSPKLKVHSGIPYVAYSDWEMGGATVMKYTQSGSGGYWNSVGNEGFADNGIQDISLAFDSKGAPYVAVNVAVADAYPDIKLMSYSDVVEPSWTQVGSNVSNSNEEPANKVALFVDSYNSQDIPYVAYKTVQDQVYVKSKINSSTSWSQIGTGAFAASTGTQPCIYVDQGIPYLAYKDNTDNIVVKKYFSGNWSDVGDKVGPALSGDAETLSLYVDQGRPYVAYQNDNRKAIVKKYDGNTWLNVGASTVSTDDVYSVSLSVYNGTPYLAYSDAAIDDNQSGKATVMRFSQIAVANVNRAEVSNSSWGTADLMVDADTAGKIYWAVLPDNGETNYVPNETDILSGIVEGSVYGKIDFTAPGTSQVINITGLSPETYYKAYLVAEDSASNRSLVKVSTQFRTGTAPNAANPKVAFDPQNNRYLTVYEKTVSLEGDDKDIYGQFIDSNGTPSGSEFIISNASGLQTVPSVAYDSSNSKFLVVWQDTRNNSTKGEDIYGQFIDVDGRLLGENFAVSDITEKPSYNSQYNPVIAYDSIDHQFLIAWADYDYSNYQSDIYGQVVKWDGSGAQLSGSTVQIIHNLWYQSQPSLAFDSTRDKYFLAFLDSNDIHGQLLNDIGVPSGSEITIATEDSYYSISQTRPAVAFDTINEKFLVVWQDQRSNDYYDIYGQLIGINSDAMANLEGPNFVISNPEALGAQERPAVAYDGEMKKYLVTWQGGQSGSQNIYGRMINVNNDGTLTPDSVDMSISTANDAQLNPAVAYNSIDINYLVVYENHNTTPVTMGQMKVDNLLR